MALYSPISPQRFNGGAFDRDWFRQAYQMLGEKRFQTLYKCAKYITSGSNQHRRSQLYTDAVLGKLDEDSMKEEITKKRNQEKLRCYPLIPIPEGDMKTALERYEFIQKFLKESKQFGAQRRENERKACIAAMERTISRRYAGHQVQPKKTVALLRSRGWTVDYEEGLQKVFYKENLVVRMFALADWFPRLTLKRLPWRRSVSLTEISRRVWSFLWFLPSCSQRLCATSTWWCP